MVLTIRVSAKGNRGVPATRYDEIFEVAADFMNAPIVSAAMESGKGEEWTAAMDAERPRSPIASLGR